MSVRSFVDAAIILQGNRRDDAALALVCAAVDATAAKIYAREKNNKERNKEFMRKAMPTIVRFGFPGMQASAIRVKCVGVTNLKTDADGYVGVESIIYHTLRCGLLHECEIDKRIVFTEHTEIGDFGAEFRIPRSLIFGLIEAVRAEPCNAIEFVGK